MQLPDAETLEISQHMSAGACFSVTFLPESIEFLDRTTQFVIAAALEALAGSRTEPNALGSLVTLFWFPESAKSTMNDN